jgi:hypothetical protein
MMLIVRGVRQGPCALSGKEGECFVVDCQKGTFSNTLMSPKEFLKQVRLRSGNGAPEPMAIHDK